MNNPENRPPMNRIIIFDLDGTLIDSRKDLWNAMNLTRAEFGLPPLPLETVVQNLGDGIVNLMKRSFSDAPFPVNLDTVVAANKRHYGAHLLDSTVPYPGVPETLEKLKTAYKLAVVTNKQDVNARAILAGLDLLKYMDTVVGGGRTLSLKPDPEPLELAMAETDSGKDGSWMVGDHRTDLGAAVNTGINGCFCSFGFGRRDGQPADLVIDSFSQLADFLL